MVTKKQLQSEINALREEVEALKLTVRTLVGVPSKEGARRAKEQTEAKRYVDFSMSEGFYPNEDYKGGR